MCVATQMSQDVSVDEPQQKKVQHDCPQARHNNCVIELSMSPVMLTLLICLHHFFTNIWDNVMQEYKTRMQHLTQFSSFISELLF